MFPYHRFHSFIKWSRKAILDLNCRFFWEMNYLQFVIFVNSVRLRCYTRKNIAALLCKYPQMLYMIRSLERNLQLFSFLVGRHLTFLSRESYTFMFHCHNCCFTAVLWRDKLFRKTCATAKIISPDKFLEGWSARIYLGFFTNSQNEVGNGNICQKDISGICLPHNFVSVILNDYNQACV